MLPTFEREGLVLVGHSLGGKVLIKTLARCAKHRIRVKNLILLGAAIDNNDADIEVALAATHDIPCSVVNMEDYALWFYRQFETCAAMGTGYKSILPKTKFIEIVSEQGNFHHVIAYLRRYQKYCQNTSDDTGIVVPQDLYNIELGVYDGKVWWSNLYSYNNWQLQQNNVTGHCRILYPWGERVAWGSRTLMFNSFEKVVWQLSDRKISESSRNIPNLTHFVEVPQDEINANLEVVDGEVWWNTIQELDGWKLQQHKLTSHCRILDPNKIRRAWGSESNMNNSFQKVHEQIATGHTSCW
ncbi:MAG: hypothetical protein Q4C70_14105 [Planctomycetia bacterium]|nr:hypothetical protein [Planctomycetia bacterium]